MGFLKSLFGSGKAASTPAPAPAPPKPPAQSTQSYTDLGPSVGSCSTCGRATYAIAGPALMRLTLSDQIDKVEANSMWCLGCDTVYCMGCAHKSAQKCAKCSGTLGDQYHRKSR